MKSQVIEIKVGRLTRPVAGGPFHDCPANMFGVNLTGHRDSSTKVLVNWPDFGIADKAEAIEALRQTLYAVADMRTAVYVGCGAGIGRTGTFLALLAKVTGTCGDEDPVVWLRHRYRPPSGAKPIETPAQEEFIREFSSFKLKTTLIWIRLAQAMLRLRRSR